MLGSGVASARLPISSDKNSVILEDLGSEGDEIWKAKKRSEFKVESDVSEDEFKKPKAYDQLEYSCEASRKGSLEKKDPNCGVFELGRNTRFDQWHSGVGKYSKSGSRPDIGVSNGEFSKVSLKRSRYECTACNKSWWVGGDHEHEPLSGLI